MDEERVPASLLDRLAFLVDLNGFDCARLCRCCMTAQRSRMPVAPAARANRQRLIEALCARGSLWRGSLRVSLLAVRSARALAALEGRGCVSTTMPWRRPSGVRAAGHARAAAGTGESVTRVATETPRTRPARILRLRAAFREEHGESEAVHARAKQVHASSRRAGRCDPGGDAGGDSGRLADAAARRGRGARRLRRAGRTGALRTEAPVGDRRYSNRSLRGMCAQSHGDLRAAAPWQRLRAEAQRERSGGDPTRRFSHHRYQQRSRRSPSSRLTRRAHGPAPVAEAKVRGDASRRMLRAPRSCGGDHVPRTARGVAAPPTVRWCARSATSRVARRRRHAAASAIDCAALLGSQALRRGETPLLVMLTDGRPM